MKRLLCIILAMSFFPGLAQSVSAAGQEAIKEDIVYYILVDRFNNGDTSQNDHANLDDPFAYHGGDLQGITEKLDHLQGNGYTTLVLSPIMANAPDGYHGYWIEDFYQVDEQFGTMDDLQELVKEAHDRDMKVVMELVTNYAAETHPMTEDPDKREWLEENSGQASFPWLDKTVALDQSNPDVQQFLTDVADYWIEEAGIDGYQFHAADQANKPFLEELTTHLQDNNPDLYLLGHILDDESYDGQLTEDTAIQMVENSDLTSIMTDVFANEGAPVAPIYEAWEADGRQEGLTYLDNPYTERFTQKFLENGRNTLTAWKLALTYLYTAPGTPMIYQGSEIPMGGAGFPENQQLVKWNSSDEDLEQFINRIAALRSEFPALQYGDYELIDSSGAMSLFKRSYEGESVYIAINNDVESQAVSIDGPEADKQLSGLLGDNLVRADDNGQYKIGLPRETTEVYVVQDDAGLNWSMITPILAVVVLFVAGIIYLNRKQKQREADA
ncbi:alpha-amylase family glycosyl hydrolase [Lentibacillus salinarum]|uniref:Alpha-amylase family glycosyl hydrolase n=1 Tax=Lentibacillus salinarum TaxID=446820 RepID=A0ABW3ZRS1_9BACI